MRKTQTYTKINTLYKRYQCLNKLELPNPLWRAFQNKIILGDFSDDFMAYIKGLKFDCFSKIDGTNSKIVYFPSTGECFPGGKTDNASIDGNGQRALLESIIERIKPTLAELFPANSAKFVPAVNQNGQPQYYLPEVMNLEGGALPTRGGAVEKVDAAGDYVVEMVEAPVYIYGEFYGKKVQKGGNYDADKQRFAIFDICMQGWYIPIDMLTDYAEKLGLEMAPYIGQMTIDEAEQMVIKGFKTRVPNPSNPDYLEEGIVARPIVPLKDPRGKRIIVKIKTCDYADLNRAIAQVGEEEYNKFKEWYNSIDPEVFKAILNPETCE